MTVANLTTLSIRNAQETNWSLSCVKIKFQDLTQRQTYYYYTYIHTTV